jgi:hypothetical protein
MFIPIHPAPLRGDRAPAHAPSARHRLPGHSRLKEACAESQVFRPEVARILLGKTCNLKMGGEHVRI